MHRFKVVGAVLCGLLVAGVLNACGAEAVPVIITAQPTVTPSARAMSSATPTAASVAVVPPTSTPVPTIERHRDQTATPGPSPTSPLRPTFTPAPATLTATALPTLVGLEIEYFTSNSEAAAPGDNVTLFWRVIGAEKISIFRLDKEGERVQEWRVSNDEGQITVSTEAGDVEEARFVVVATVGDAVLEQELALPLNCTQTWFFTPAQEGCPNGPGEPTLQVEQRFEGGLMIWLANSRTIYILYGDELQPQWLQVADQFNEGDPERDDALQAPPDRFQPIRGFGLVWRTNPRTQERLGWAIEPEIGYDGIIQTAGTTDATRRIYLRSRNGGILELLPGGREWRVIAPETTETNGQ